MYSASPLVAKITSPVASEVAELRVFEATETTLTLTFEKPADASSFQYRLAEMDVPGSWGPAVLVSESGQQQFMIAGLKVCTRYSVRVETLSATAASSGVMTTAQTNTRASTNENSHLLTSTRSSNHDNKVLFFDASTVQRFYGFADPQIRTPTISHFYAFKPPRHKSSILRRFHGSAILRFR
ncbi:unnamed protein product [Protopolystoma xenopodis]|uniref:Fibronectin type-III domain-containing protein n=1 Tax=Protopolystoma xenopodis TaxID=117903 RepID=A0A448XN45_9PLAT|nr:unnamed protein product [Protopolystoma xenopodis]